MSDTRDREIETLRARLDASEKREAKEAQERKADQERIQRAEERKATTAALTEAGVDPRRVPFAVAHLFEKGTITRDESGAIVATITAPWGGDRQVSLALAIAAYLTTAEGKAMLPDSEAPTGGPRRMRTMTPSLAGAVLGALPRPTVVPEGQRRTMTVAEAAVIIGEMSRG